MAAEFVFEPPSDEELKYENEDTDDSGSGSEEVDSEDEENTKTCTKNNKKSKQTPWDFSSYVKSVAEEHASTGTTSIDFKISKALQRRSGPFIIDHEEDDSDAEPHRQEDYRPEEDDDVEDTVDCKPFFSPADGVSYRSNSFMELNLSRPLLRAIEALGWTKPTAIQAACIPMAMAGRDICGSAITGSGKTAAFALPTLERLLYRPKNRPAIRVLILTPTRELAVQICSMIGQFTQFMKDIRCCAVFGGTGTSIKTQEADLRSKPDIVVATPGRLIDHLRNSMSIDLDDLSVLIFDEADRLLEDGFSAEIQELVKMSPKRRQTMLFSATMTEEIDELMRLSLKNPLRLAADPSMKRPEKLIEEVIRIRRSREGNQEAVLLALCSRTFTSRVIIFCGTKKEAHRLKILFGLAGLKAAELHADRTQPQRLEALELYKTGQVDFLIGTNLLARGIDIIGVQTVINFVCPRDLNAYVHRVGRTARAGREGYAVTFVTDNDRTLLKAILKRVGSRLKTRIVAEQSINKWSDMIEQMEDQVAAILKEERLEMAMRKAEMEVTKAENMITHNLEIYSRPKKTWHITEMEKKRIAEASKVSAGKGSQNEVISAEQAEDLKMKEKRKREHEKNLPRRKRRKLEAARERLEEDDGIENGNEKNKKEKVGISLVDLGHRKAKAVKAKKKAADAGKFVRKVEKRLKRPTTQKTQSRTQEMQELFQSDMNEKKLKRHLRGGGPKKKSSFKSKSRYKRK